MKSLFDKVYKFLVQVITAITFLAIIPLTVYVLYWTFAPFMLSNVYRVIIGAVALYSVIHINKSV